MGPTSSSPWYNGRSVLVTGGAGFIGSHLVSLLSSGGAHVFVLDNRTDTPWSNLNDHEIRYTRMEGDVRDSATIEHVFRTCSPAIVFHLAANASVPNSVENPRYDFETNALGTFNVLEATRLIAPHARVVFASSGAVYGEPGRAAITEETPTKPISPYGASKLAGELHCRVYAETYSLNVIIGRIFNSFGPRMPRFVVLDFLRKLTQSSEVLEILGSGRQTRDFTYVSDTVAGLLLLAERGERGAAYNIASGVSHSVTQLARQLLQLRGLTSTTELRFTGDSWAGDAQHWEVCLDKIRTLGYTPRFSLGDGLAEVVSWFSKQEVAA